MHTMWHSRKTSHSALCIALHLCDSSTGFWVFLNLHTKLQVRHLQWQKIATTKLVIEQMNAYDPEAATLPTEAVQPAAVEVTQTAATSADNLPEAAAVAGTPGQEELVEEAAPEEHVEQDGDDDSPELDVQGDDDSSDKEEEEEEGPRWSARIAGDILKPSRYAMVIRIAKSKLNSKEWNKVIEKAEAKKIEHFFVDL